MDGRDGQNDDSNSTGMAAKLQDWDGGGKELEECIYLQVD